MPNNTTFTFNISSAANFNTDIALIDVGGADAGTGNTYDFNITAGFTLNQQLDAINLQGGTSGKDVLNITGATAPGGTATLDGANTYNGFFVYAGNVDISDLTLNQMQAVGGAGGSGEDGGGGGLGAGGALFVASGGSATLGNVTLTYNKATGGAGGISNPAGVRGAEYNYGGPVYHGGGGGGGLGGAGASWGFAGGGGGGVGMNAGGGKPTFYTSNKGYQGIILGAGGGGTGASKSGFAGGADGGGGGAGDPGGGGGVGGGGGSASSYDGGNGGFGGGGGGAVGNGASAGHYAVGGAGGFGGGGGSGQNLGGAGGFGGGGGAGYTRGGIAGFGGKPGGFGGHESGGGGAGLGGAIFVQAGGSIAFQGSLTLGDNTTAGGAGNGGTAAHLGDGIFLQGGGTAFTFDPQAGQTETFDNSIADQSAGGGGGSWSLTMDGAGTLVLGAANSFSGGITLTAGTLDLAVAGAAGSGAITFENSQVDPTLEFTLTDVPTNAIDGFATGDNIQIDGFTEQSGTYWDNTLTLQGTNASGGSATVTLDIPNELPSNFAVTVAADTTTISYGQNETNIVACYRRGTLIEVARGQKQVEALNIGDKVRTASGALRPIKWIGRRSYGGRFIMGRKDILPVCFKSGALADNVPARDLWVSPNHAMYLKSVLIEAKDLINGVSIVQAERVETLEYFHIELETHDVIIAEGALAESFIDDDSRAMFHNAHDYATLYAQEHAAPAHYCAPRLDEGYEVEVVRQHLAQRAGLLRSADAPQLGALRGYIDRIRASSIAGWAQNADAPEAPVCLDIFADGKLIGRVLANSYRDDLKRAGLGSGRHAFTFTPPASLDVAPDTIDVRRSLDGAALERSTACAQAVLAQSRRRAAG